MATTIYMDRADKNKIGIFEIEDVRVIPVIFLPGIMGSNLMAKRPGMPPDETANEAVIWRYDSSSSLIEWSLATSGPVKRKNLLHPDKVQVDKRGSISLSAGAKDFTAIQYPQDSSDKEAIAQYIEAVSNAVDSIDAEAALFGSRRDRGWGEVAKGSYGEFLDKLQSALYRDKPSKKQPLHAIYQRLINEKLGTECGDDALSKECIETMYPYQFPVHAVGYNWLGSNKDSALRLSHKVDKIITAYNDRGMKCHKVILVTHSMGGLVARYYSECLDSPGRDKIYGIVHGVMPSTGAAATYTRMKRGTENTGSTLTGYIASHILGRNAAEMTAICSQSPGPLELLPSAEYGTQWLKIIDRHGVETILPGINPYDNLYLRRDVWWKLVDENLLNPLNVMLMDSKIEYDWKIYKEIILKFVQPFHKIISGRYHSQTYSFYGKCFDKDIHGSQRTSENVQWIGVPIGGEPKKYPTVSKYGDGRLDLNEMSFYRTVEDTLSEEEKVWGIKENDSITYTWLGQRFSLLGASDNGDGTVPICSGQIINENIKERLPLQIEHESAYKDETSQAFTLRSIIKIVQQVISDKEMSYDE